MGRSVSYLSNAFATAYFHPEVEDRSDWLSLIEDIQETIKGNFPEFENANEWEGRENHVIQIGGGCKIAISEYCGLACLSIGSCNYYHYDENEVEKWMADNWDKISEPWNAYKKIATASNGESFYHKVN